MSTQNRGKLEEAKIKQTRRNLDPIRFRDDAINKVKKKTIYLENQRAVYSILVSKDSHQKDWS